MTIGSFICAKSQNISFLCDHFILNKDYILHYLSYLELIYMVEEGGGGSSAPSPYLCVCVGGGGGLSTFSDLCFNYHSLI